MMPLQGVKGLDVLFVLCGFFAALALVPALERTRGSLTQASAKWLMNTLGFCYWCIW